MKRALIIGMSIATLGGHAMLTAQVARNAEVQMKAAQQKADVQGDLKGAIEDYRRIAAGAGSNRALASLALVRMADCYEKLGDAQARAIYKRVVRDFADQAEAVSFARAHLGANSATVNAGIATRQVWTGPKVDSYGSVSPDGRFLSFTDWDTGDLALHDLVTGANRNLTNKGSWDASAEYAMDSRVSRDGRQIAYTWRTSVVPPGEDTFSEIRLLDVNGGKPRVLFSNRGALNSDVKGIAPMDWSPDGKWLAVSIGRKDRTTATARLSTGDGTLQVLEVHRDCEPSFNCGTQLLISPDGRYLAYDWAANGDARQRQIYLVGADGRSKTALLGHPANDRLMGWTPDGRYLVFASDRGGLSGVWAMAVIDGQPSGEPQLLRANVSPASLGITRAGVVYYALGNSSRDVYVADVDFMAGRVLSAPSIIPRPYVGMNDYPRWSPDGRYLAYLSKHDPNTRATQFDMLMIRSIQTGEVQELPTGLRYLNVENFGPLWTRDGKSLLMSAIDHADRQGIYRVDAHTGEARAVVLPDPGQGDVVARALSADGTILYISRNFYTSRNSNAPSDEIMLAHDLSSGSEREIARRRNSWGRGFDVSPDGRWIARTAVDRDTNVTHLFVYSTESGAERELLRESPPELIAGSFVQFAPDGKSILFAKGTPPKGNEPWRNEFWRISIDSGDVRTISLDVNWATRLVQPGTTSVSIHPDGHHVAFAMGGNEVEIWAMENIMSALKAGK
jgi:Tol biopolymer transport system component